MHSLPHEDTMYRALLDCDSRFEGVFFFGVKTTGIFCRPTCRVRKPKRENVEYYPSSKDALLHGYRPCKRCRPLGQQGTYPEWLQPIMEEVGKTPGIRLKDSDLVYRGVDPNRIRRWFKQHLGLTFQGYLRMLRINEAFGRIQNGDKVIEAAMESGYDSLSGFTSSFKKATGISPKAGREQVLIHVTRILTPLGPMLAGAVDEGICLLEFTDRRMLETQLTVLKKRLHAVIIPGRHLHFQELERQITEYFDGQRNDFTVPLILPGTPFQQKVWDELQRIPYAETRTYGQQAVDIGNPKAVRAVARANGDNRIAIIVPCHRVIGADGKLTGYGGGLWRKRYLLDLESRNC